VTINKLKLYWNLISYLLRKLTEKQCLTDVVWRAIKFFVQWRTKRTRPANPQLPKRPCLQNPSFSNPNSISFYRDNASWPEERWKGYYCASRGGRSFLPSVEKFRRTGPALFIDVTQGGTLAWRMVSMTVCRAAAAVAEKVLDLWHMLR
jgi:hypothetical protein